MTEKTDSLAWADSELAQCEAEVGTLLQIISELNMKMSALKLPCDRKVYETQLQTCKPASDLNSSSPATQIRPGAHSGSASVKSVIKKHYEGSSGEIWTKLQQVLSTLESSASRRRKLVAPHIQDDDKTQEVHITAARDIWVQATQVLEEIERELGISYASALPTEVRQKYQKEVLSLGQLNRELSSSLQKRQEEQKKMEGGILEMKQEKKLLQEKLDKLKNKWLVTPSSFPPRSPSLSHSKTSSRSWASPTIPASPFFSRRMSISPTGSPSRPRRPSSGSSVLVNETECLQRSLDRLKARNERLTSALERRKSESEQVSMALSRYEADCSALNVALSYSEACEEAYCDLLSLCEARKQQNAALAEASTPEHIGNLSAANKESFCTTVTTQSSLSTEEFKEKTGVIRQRIGRLKQDRATVCIPQETRTGEGKLSPDTGTLAGTRKLSFLFSNNPKEEKTALLCELTNVRRINDCQAELGSGPWNHVLTRELHAARERELALKRKVTSLRELLETAMSATNRRVNKEEVARLLFYHNKALSACRSARKMNHEQLWRIKRQMTAMQERHKSQLAELKSMLEALEWKKEESVL
ncbi:colorectal mutant cancer protein isoform X3 [Silurus meridionalis]|uniref:colorectal mutant cancer protein isoform X3 n=1 Tax=Silurus meridionalis TaxID=175797 RepID=UPI001EEC63F6|nr:colorectal mutant cancer protein isoform X3 [Silurus meridionalis]